MKLIDAINIDNLHKYSNVDVSTIECGYTACNIISKFDYTKLNMFVDIFDDVNKRTDITKFVTTKTLAENVMYAMYSRYVTCTLTENQKMMILFKLIQRGFSRSMFDDVCKRREYAINNLYIDHKIHITKCYNITTNLRRLTNSDTISIDVCKFNDSIIDTIKVLLLIAKTRIIPKYIILHKILLFYLGC